MYLDRKIRILKFGIKKRLKLNDTLEASLSLSLFIHAANIGFMLMFTFVVAPAIF